MPIVPENGALTEESIRERLRASLVRPAIPPENMRWRRAAVLVPLLRNEREWHLLFIRRTESVADHKGQVAFPGGAMEGEDASLEVTALRESQEEIGLPQHSVSILGRLPDFYTISNYLITPVVGVIGWPFPLALSMEEVSRVFTIPLLWLADPANHEERLYTRPDGLTHENVIFFSPYEGEILWGATARITLTFLQILGLHE